MSRQATDSLGTHRVPLVSHSRRTDLSRFERFFDFLRGSNINGKNTQTTANPCLQVSQQPNIRRDLVCSRTKRSKRGQNIDIDLSRVRLRSHRIGVSKPRELSDDCIQFFDFFMVTIKECQIAGLCPCSALDTPETKVLSRTFDVP